MKKIVVCYIIQFNKQTCLELELVSYVKYKTSFLYTCVIIIIELLFQNYSSIKKKKTLLLIY